MRDYINLSEFGTFDNLIFDMPVRLWDEPKPAKVLTKQNDYVELQYFTWYAPPGKGMGVLGLIRSGVVGLSEDLHLDQVWIESGWQFLVLK